MLGLLSLFGTIPAVLLDIDQPAQPGSYRKLPRPAVGRRFTSVQPPASTSDTNDSVRGIVLMWSSVDVGPQLSNDELEIRMGLPVVLISILGKASRQLIRSSMAT